MNEQDNNSARRLHDIISQGPNPGDNQTAWNVFSNILKVPSDEPVVLFDRIAQTVLLTKEIKSAVEAIPEINSELYLTWYPKASAAVESLNLAANWKSFASGFPPESMMAIDFCADLLSRYNPERRVSEPDLNSLIQQVEDLINDLDMVEVRSADWQFIYHHLTKIREVLATYKIGGLRPLEDKYAQTIGAMLLAPEIVRALKEHENGKRFYAIIGAVATVLSIYGGVRTLPEDITRIIDNEGYLEYVSLPSLPVEGEYSDVKNSDDSTS